MALDRFVPGASSTTLALATRDVYRYLRNAGVRDVIGGRAKGATRGRRVRRGLALTWDGGGIQPAAAGRQQGWRVPLLVTLGSPLGVTAIVRSLRPIEHPPVVSSWFNAYDDRDVVALYPLDSARFPVQPMIENYGAVQNPTPNKHGITGYLDDPEVAAPHPPGGHRLSSQADPRRLRLAGRPVYRAVLCKAASCTAWALLARTRDAPDAADSASHGSAPSTIGQELRLGRTAVARWR